MITKAYVVKFISPTMNNTRLESYAELCSGLHRFWEVTNSNYPENILTMYSIYVLKVDVYNVIMLESCGETLPVPVQVCRTLQIVMVL